MDDVRGEVRGTYRSVLLGLSGPDVVRFARSWSGTLCWQVASPYRSGMGRKNWYVIAEVQGADGERTAFSPDDVDLVAYRTVALDLLRRQFEQADAAAGHAAVATRWRTHDQLVRGNPTRIEKP